MASITITANVTVDIHLESVSMESYQKLVDYINGMDEAESKPEVQTEVWEEREAKRVAAPQTKPLDLVRAALKEANDHPGDYVWHFCKAHDWKQYVPQISQMPDKQLGNLLGRLVSSGEITKETYYDKGTQQYYQRFMLPVPTTMDKPKLPEPVKAEPEKPVEQPVTASKAQQLATTLNYRDQEAGEILRSARKGAGMTLRDMSEAIGYDVSIINAWEVGKCHIADLQRKAICDYFHRDIFAEATATA
jgi:hypothetical protein